MEVRVRLGWKIVNRMRDLWFLSVEQPARSFHSLVTDSTLPGIERWLNSFQVERMMTMLIRNVDDGRTRCCLGENVGI